MLKDKYNIWENIKAGINATLPILILVALLSWGVKLIFKLIQPFVVLMAPRAQDQTVFVKTAALILVLFIVFLVGLLLRTPRGRRRFARVETKLFMILPGYSLIKEVFLQLIGTKKMPFSRVALVNPYGNATRQIGFITDEHADGSFSVFVPTGPNPTSGNIFILSPSQVRPIDVPVEQVMKAIIGCGLGSGSVVGGRKKEEY